MTTETAGFAGPTHKARSAHDACAFNSGRI
jgi:hypothetical protein